MNELVKLAKIDYQKMILAQRNEKEKWRAKLMGIILDSIDDGYKSIANYFTAHDGWTAQFQVNGCQPIRASVISTSNRSEQYHVSWSSWNGMDWIKHLSIAEAIVTAST